MDRFLALRAEFRAEGVIVDPVTNNEPFDEDWNDPDFDPETGAVAGWLETCARFEWDGIRRWNRGPGNRIVGYLDPETVTKY
jgi:hypothetical protein